MSMERFLGQIALDRVEGVEWEYSASTSSDKATSTIAYTDRFDGWMGRAPMGGSPHPDLPGMVLVELDSKMIDGGLIRVICKFETNDFSLSYPGRSPKGAERFDMEVSTAEEHILTHPRYSDLSEDERRALYHLANASDTDESGAKWEDMVTTEKGLEVLAKIRKGNTHYLEPRLVWTRRFNLRSVSQVDLDKVGKIDTPPGGAPVDGSRNYLNMGLAARQDDDAKGFNAEQRWELSGPEGWDPDLYGEA